MRASCVCLGRIVELNLVCCAKHYEAQIVRRCKLHDVAGGTSRIPKFDVAGALPRGRLSARRTSQLREDPVAAMELTPTMLLAFMLIPEPHKPSMNIAVAADYAAEDSRLKSTRKGGVVALVPV